MMMGLSSKKQSDSLIVTVELPSKTRSQSFKHIYPLNPGKNFIKSNTRNLNQKRLLLFDQNLQLNATKMFRDTFSIQPTRSANLFLQELVDKHLKRRLKCTSILMKSRFAYLTKYQVGLMRFQLFLGQLKVWNALWIITRPDSEKYDVTIFH